MISTSLELLSEHGCFDVVQRFYQHASGVIGLPMRFSVYLPPQATRASPTKVPALLYLAGLTCNEETFMAKADVQRLAGELGLALRAPDTNPRGANLPGDSDSWDFGVGRHFWALHGWAWRLVFGAETPAPVPVGVSLGPDLRAQPVSVGAKGVRGLSGQGPNSVAST